MTYFVFVSFLQWRIITSTLHSLGFFHKFYLLLKQFYYTKAAEGAALNPSLHGFKNDSGKWVPKSLPPRKQYKSCPDDKTEVVRRQVKQGEGSMKEFSLFPSDNFIQQLPAKTSVPSSAWQPTSFLPVYLIKTHNASLWRRHNKTQATELLHMCDNNSW